MEALLAVTLLLDARARLADAVEEGRPGEIRAAVAELASEDPRKAASALAVELPRARRRLETLLAGTLQARGERHRIDTGFVFTSLEQKRKESDLEEAERGIREACDRAIAGEKVYDALRESFALLPPEAADAIAARLDATRSWLVSCELLEGLTEMGVSGLSEAAVHRKQEPVVLAAAVRGLRPEAAADYLAHAQWQVRLAALEAVGGSKEGAARIIDAMAAEPDARLRGEASDLLEKLTGTALPADPEAWKQWWKANGEDFVAGRYDPRRPVAPREPGRTTFYGAPVRSTRVCFVVDRSRSMRTEGRFEEARRELLRSLDTLPDGALVNILFFEESLSCFALTPRELDRESRREAARFVDRQEVGEGTDLHAALEKALTFVGSPDRGTLREDGVDTIVVLSDGQATVGRVVDGELVARDVARRARYLRPVIHTVSLGVPSPSLKLLAELTGGEYRVH